jgi:hypothetical protein
MKTLHVRNLVLLAAFAAANVAVAAGPAGQAGAAAGAKGGAAVTLPGAAGGATVGGAANVGAGASANKPTDIPSPNTKAEESANGQFTEDRKFGQDRAAERRSEQGAENEKATEALEDKASANAKPPRKPSN